MQQKPKHLSFRRIDIDSVVLVGQYQSLDLKNMREGKENDDTTVDWVKSMT
jgi:hypothetical protein